MALGQLAQTLLVCRADGRSRTTSPRSGGNRSFFSPLAQKLLHEPAAHAEPIRYLLTGFQPLITGSTDSFTKIKGVGFHAKPPVVNKSQFTIGTRVQ